eukprot:3826562-Amphidinium_carterae.1
MVLLKRSHCQAAHTRLLPPQSVTYTQQKVCSSMHETLATANPPSQNPMKKRKALAKFHRLPFTYFLPEL